MTTSERRQLHSWRRFFGFALSYTKLDPADLAHGSQGCSLSYRCHPLPDANRRELQVRSRSEDNRPRPVRCRKGAEAAELPAYRHDAPQMLSVRSERPALVAGAVVWRSGPLLGRDP